MQFHQRGNRRAAQGEKCAPQLDSLRRALLEISELCCGVIFRIKQFQKREQISVMMKHRRRGEQQQMFRVVRELQRIFCRRRNRHALALDDAVRLIHDENIPVFVEQFLVF